MSVFIVQPGAETGIGLSVFFAECKHAAQDFAAFGRVIFPPGEAPCDDAQGISGKLVCELRFGGVKVVNRQQPVPCLGIVDKILQQQLQCFFLRLAVEDFQRALLIHAVAGVDIRFAGVFLHVCMEGGVLDAGE